MEDLVSLGIDLSLHRWEFGLHLMRRRVCRNESTKWQHRLVAGGARSVGMTVNFSEKTLNNALCPQWSLPLSEEGFCCYGVTASQCARENSVEQALASGNLASKTFAVPQMLHVQEIQVEG